ncbi:MAG: universal stress protein [Pseudomonadota bacterium]
MVFRNLLVYLDHTRGGNTRLELAVALAQEMEAHLTALALVGEVFFPTMAGVSLPPQILQEQTDAAERRCRELLEQAKQRAERAGISMETRHETANMDRLPFVLARHGRHADMTIVGQADPENSDFDDTLLAEAAFMDSGRPAIVVPHSSTLRGLPERILVAWDGSREAVRAVNDSLPFLRRAKMVTVLVIDPDRYRAHLGEAPGADLATHLSRHGVEVTVKATRSDGIGVGETIAAETKHADADMITMGGYGHSRLREVLIGGVTQYLLNRAPVPIFISH